MNLKKIIDSPYTAPVMTPLKWIGKSLVAVTGPYVRAAKKAAKDTKPGNPVLKFLDKLLDEAPPLVAIPGILGFVGGIIGGGMLCGTLLAGTGLVTKVVGGLAILSAITATSTVAAPFVAGVAIAAATLVAVSSVATVPGVLSGFKTTYDHVRGKGVAPAAAVAATAPAPASATTLDQIIQHVSALSESEQQAVLDRLTNKAANDFGAAAKGEQPELDKDITLPKTIKLKNTP